MGAEVGFYNDGDYFLLMNVLIRRDRVKIQANADFNANLIYLGAAVITAASVGATTPQVIAAASARAAVGEVAGGMAAPTIRSLIGSSLVSAGMAFAYGGATQTYEILNGRRSDYDVMQLAIGALMAAPVGPAFLATNQMAQLTKTLVFSSAIASGTTTVIAGINSGNMSDTYFNMGMTAAAMAGMRAFTSFKSGWTGAKAESNVIDPSKLKVNPATTAEFETFVTRQGLTEEQGGFPDFNLKSGKTWQDFLPEVQQRLNAAKTKYGDLNLRMSIAADDLPWSYPAARRAAIDIEKGAVKITVNSRDEASEIVWRMFRSQGYTETTGRTPTDVKNILGSKKQTYHWDERKDQQGAFKATAQRIFTGKCHMSRYIWKTVRLSEYSSRNRILGYNS